MLWRQISLNKGIAAALLLITLALYLPSVRYEFVGLDDPLYVSQNQNVQNGLSQVGTVWAFTTTKGGSWHPVTWLSYMATRQFFGAGPAPHRAVNILLHAANTTMLFGLLVMITGARWRSALVAAIFALHPLHVESVVWIAERKDTLSTTFLLLSLLAYARYALWKEGSSRRPRKFWYFLLLLSLLLGLMSKPMLVTFPFLCLLLDFWPLSRMPAAPRPFTLRPYLPLVREKIPMLVLTVFFSCLVFWSQSREGAVKAVPLEARVFNALVSYCRYIGKTLWPTDLVIYYPRHAGSWGLTTASAAFIFLVAVTVMVILTRKRWPFLLTGWFWFLGTLVPVIGLVQIGGQSIADRYMYIPMIGLGIAFAWSLGRMAASGPRARNVAVGCSLIACVACFLQAQGQIRLWKNTETLFSHAEAVTKNNPVAHLNLAMYYEAVGNTNKAERFYHETLLAMPNNVEAHNNLGRLLANRGQTNEALIHYEHALRVDPKNAMVHYNLGLLYLATARTNEAADEFSKTIALAPDNALAYGNLGAIRAQQGKLSEAIVLFRNAVKWAPNSPEQNFNLGLALHNRGKTSEAVRYLAAALRLRPNYAKAQSELDLILEEQKQKSAELEDKAQAALNKLVDLALQSGDTEKAVATYRKLLEVAPDSESALNDFAWLLATCRDARFRNGPEAVTLAKKAVALSKTHREHYLDTLAAAYAEAGNFDLAVTTAKEALTTARQSDNTNAVTNMEKRLKMYEARQPFRE